MCDIVCAINYKTSYPILPTRQHNCCQEHNMKKINKTNDTSVVLKKMVCYTRKYIQYYIHILDFSGKTKNCNE